MITARQLLGLFTLLEEQKEMLYHSTTPVGIRGILSSNRIDAVPQLPEKSRKPGVIYSKDDTIPGVSFTRSKSKWHSGDTETEYGNVKNPFRLIMDKGSMEKETKLSPYSYSKWTSKDKEQETRSLAPIENITKHLQGIEFNTRGYDKMDIKQTIDSLRRYTDAPINLVSSTKMNKDRYKFHSDLQEK